MTGAVCGSCEGEMERFSGKFGFAIINSWWWYLIDRAFALIDVRQLKFCTIA